MLFCVNWWIGEFKRSKYSWIPFDFVKIEKRSDSLAKTEDYDGTFVNLHCCFDIEALFCHDSIKLTLMTWIWHNCCCIRSLKGSVQSMRQTSAALEPLEIYSQISTKGNPWKHTNNLNPVWVPVYFQTHSHFCFNLLPVWVCSSVLSDSKVRRIWRRRLLATPHRYSRLGIKSGPTLTFIIWVGFMPVWVCSPGLSESKAGRIWRRRLLATPHDSCLGIESGPFIISRRIRQAGYRDVSEISEEALKAWEQLPLCLSYYRYTPKLPLY